ncbi:hypothetical protein [Tellurirhabdus bombi]|uniref:hypothetical protein n=1 Tax=Tellurirhabdus bombi TaxID=2907205 RepID=UPI001F3DB406|nr:hypothetical protein [Tellurirhabdus bombi]
MEASSLTPYPPPSSQRPTFLTVLCVLTFLSCAWGIFNAISSYSGADLAASVTQESLEQAQDNMQGQEGSQFIEKMLGSVSESMSPERIRQSSIATIVVNLLALAGALLMWNLRKVGFYIYVASVLVAVVSPVIIFGGLIGGIAGVSTAFFSIIFLVLYALNLKHMR